MNFNIIKEQYLESGKLFIEIMDATALESRGALKVLNVPERDDRIGDRLNAYQNTRYASFQGFSGINDGIFINTRFADSNQVFVKFQSNFHNL